MNQLSVSSDIDLEQSPRLLRAFYDFYAEIAAYKDAFKSGDFNQLFGQALTTSRLGWEADLAAMTSRQIEVFLLTQREGFALEAGALELRFYNEVLYAMAALADEIFILNFEWPGKNDFSQYGLEDKLFSSAQAGDLMFEKIETLLKERSVDDFEIQLGGVYLMCLRLGFVGRCRGRENEEKIAKYMSDLSQFINRKNDTRQRYFPAAYARLINNSVAGRLAPLTPWWRMLAIATAVYLLLSYYIWHSSIQLLESLFS